LGLGGLGLGKVEAVEDCAVKGITRSEGEDAMNLERPLYGVELELPSDLFENDFEVKLTHSSKLQRAALFILADLSVRKDSLHCQEN